MKLVAQNKKNTTSVVQKRMQQFRGWLESRETLLQRFVVADDYNEYAYEDEDWTFSDDTTARSGGILGREQFVDTRPAIIGGGSDWMQESRRNVMQSKRRSYNRAMSDITLDPMLLSTTTQTAQDKNSRSSKENASTASTASTASSTTASSTTNNDTTESPHHIVSSLSLFSNHVMVNRTRLDVGVPALRRNTLLDEYAQDIAQQAAAAAANNSGTTSAAATGSSRQYCLLECTIHVRCGASVQEIHNAILQERSDHYATLIDPQYTEFGMGTSSVVVNDNESGNISSSSDSSNTKVVLYMTQVFRKRIIAVKNPIHEEEEQRLPIPWEWSGKLHSSSSLPCTRFEC